MRAVNVLRRRGLESGRTNDLCAHARAGQVAVCVCVCVRVCVRVCVCVCVRACAGGGLALRIMATCTIDTVVPACKKFLHVT